MKDIVIISVYNRAEMLKLCLEHLSRCPDINDKEVWVYEDQVGNKSSEIQNEIECVISGISPTFKNFWHIKHAAHDGPAWDNIFEALHRANDLKPNFIHFLEDDVMVTQDYFRWTEQAHRQFQPFITNGDNPWKSMSNDPLAVILSHSECHVHAGCISSENLKKVLNESRRYPRHWEEILQNYIIKNKQLIVSPSIPRAFDCGYYGENKPSKMLAGNLTEKIQEVHKQISGQYRETPVWEGDFVISDDRRHLWDEAYKAQSKYGWSE